MESTGKIAVGKGEIMLTAYHKFTAAGHQVTSICDLEYHVCTSGNKLVFLLVVQLLYYISSTHFNFSPKYSLLTNLISSSGFTQSL